MEAEACYENYFMPEEFSDNKENLRFLSSHSEMPRRFFGFVFLIKKQLLVFVGGFSLS